ncbi:Na+-translocating ferredoxin:NAD+ oxidoreductase RNF, RnfC subunit [Natronincola peptidivorans]|uniref:Na+-translocating ferredoxin:NAD+ oxidoreductase RNF, RnfC subunit n=1 Tax=Natronincola peptidivorans TaxID=426128 RepID=A0A1I0CGW2_9FIRM|nr:4Fe-4S dicluster domain-containing protein [Natronincola peptidivorans]SET18194.1 Na+-translocating ferredoxin:NAD+ oxidoreductase RNF, RnfC subunit [Natronincola peptidivorans]
MNRTTLVETAFECGIVGAGGAGFPTHVKLNNKVKTVILNCAECEPLLRVDRQLMAVYTFEILEALSHMVVALEAEEGIIAIKSTYKDALDAVTAIISTYDSLKIKILPHIYPAGDEVNLIYEVTNKIVPQGGLPIQVGAMVLNVETVLNLYHGLNYHQPVTHTYVTVVGEVEKPCTLPIPIGTTVEKAIACGGGAKTEDYSILMGGPMTGTLLHGQEVVTKTTKALIVLPSNHKLVLSRKIRPSFHIKRAMSVCSQCRMCTDLCPRYLLGHSIEPHRFMNQIAHGITKDAKAFTMTLACCGCGVCEKIACHQGLSPQKLMEPFKKKLSQQGIKPHTSDYHEEKLHFMRNSRLIPQERLIEALGLKKYDVHAPLDFQQCNPDVVRIPLQQHIGQPAIPIVQRGMQVKTGELIGDIPEGKLGAKIHASVDGEIIDVNSSTINIRVRGDHA